MIGVGLDTFLISVYWNKVVSRCVFARFWHQFQYM